MVSALFLIIKTQHMKDKIITFRFCFLRFQINFVYFQLSFKLKAFLFNFIYFSYFHLG